MKIPVLGEKTQIISEERKADATIRLNRIEGQIKGLKKMVTEGRPCVEILTQLASTQEALDALEERCVSILDLVPYFDGRYVRNHCSWKEKIIPELQAFLTKLAHESDHLRLIIDAHLSVAFAAGAVLNVKSGKHVEVEQRTDGRRFWSVKDTAPNPAWPKIIFEEEDVSEGGNSIALAISLTHDVSPAVRASVKSMSLPVRTILHCKLQTGFSQRSTYSGRHASMLAEAIVQKLQTVSQSFGSQRHTHIFMAGPNGFAFFLGQHQKAIGPASIYEWDFDGQRGGGYA